MTKYCGVYDSGAVPTYDQNGQMTADGGGDTFTWDTRRHLSAISGNYTAAHVYDALGRRVSKTIYAATTELLYDGLNPVQELNGSGGVIANMLTGPNIDEYFTRTEPGCCGPLSYLTDALGTTQSLVAGLSVGLPFGLTRSTGSGLGSSGTLGRARPNVPRAKLPVMRSGGGGAAVRCGFHTTLLRIIRGWRGRSGLHRPL